MKVYSFLTFKIDFVLIIFYILKEIGEVLRDNITALDPKKSVVLLGVANWVNNEKNRMY